MTKKKSKCSRCHALGHWHQDPVCPLFGKPDNKPHGVKAVASATVSEPVVSVVHAVTAGGSSSSTDVARADSDSEGCFAWYIDAPHVTPAASQGYLEL